MHAPTIRFPTRGLVAMLVALQLVSGCGGVDSGGTGAVAMGPITGFGSIIVNGVHFDETSAAIRDDDGAPVAAENLALGVTTEIEAFAPNVVAGSLRAVATSIRVSSDLVGPVTAVDSVAGTLTVLGQAVLVTPATAFGVGLTGGLAGVSVGTLVEVYGRLDPARSLYTATRIQTRTSAAAYKLRGLISAVDAARSTLVIGGQSIDYSGVTAPERTNAVVGNIVRASLQPSQSAATWIAVALPSGIASLPDRETATLEGRISAFVTTRSFAVSGVTIDASQATFPNGEAGVVLGARVAVSGSSSGGVVYARTVDFEGDETSGNSLYELEGLIQSIDTANSTFSVRGITVAYGAAVTYVGGSAQDLAVGRDVDVRGALAPDGMSIVATRIEFEH